MRVCRDLLAGFVGIGSEKSVDVAVCDILHVEEGGFFLVTEMPWYRLAAKIGEGV